MHPRHNTQLVLMLTPCSPMHMCWSTGWAGVPEAAAHAAGDGVWRLQQPGGGVARSAHSSCSHYVACSTAMLPAIPPVEHIIQLHGAQEWLHVGTRAVPCWIQPNSSWCASTHTMLSLRNSLSTCHGHHVTCDGRHFAQLANAHLHPHGCCGCVAAVQAIASVLQQLFAGGFSFVTTCKACGQSGEASRRVNDFTELSLQVGCSRGGVTGPFIGGSR